MHPESIRVRIRDRIRLDVFLTRTLASVSRSRIQRHIAAGNVLVDGKRVRPSHLLLGNELVTLPPLEVRQETLQLEAVAVPVVYEDADLVVVNKPPDLVMHPVGGEFRRTLIGALRLRLEAAGEDPSELGIVHRLDRLTSGLVIVAKRLRARRALSRAVEARAVRRAYLAVAAGVVPADRGRIDLHIRRDPVRPTRMQALDAAALEAALRTGSRPRVSRSGYSDPRLDLRPREACTRYRVLRRLQGATLVQARLETGRTHQIRVHMQGIGAPLLGDPLYGPGETKAARAAWDPAVLAASEALGRPALHAAALGFVQPSTGESLHFRAPLPEDLRRLVLQLGR